MVQGHSSIQTLLGGLLKNRQLVASMRRVMVLSLWEQVVGALIAHKSWPETVTDGVLTVGVISHAWAEQLHLLKPQVLTRYRQLLGRSVLKDIRFRVGRRRLTAREELTTTPPLHPAPQEALPAAPVPGHLLVGVENAEVRELLGPAFARFQAARAWKHAHGWARCSACGRIFHSGQCPECGADPSTPPAAT
jgi:predicted nucleic acid-binding Zn ribbon protein